MLLTRLLDVLFLSLPRKAASWITSIGPQTVNRFARAHTHPSRMWRERAEAHREREAEADQSDSRSVGERRDRPAPSTGDTAADLNLRPLLLWTNLTGSFTQQHGRTERVRKPVHHVGEQGGGEEETGRHHQPLERQPARPVRDQPAHRGRRPPRSSRRGRGPAGPHLGEWETIGLPPADTWLWKCWKPSCCGQRGLLGLLGGKSPYVQGENGCQTPLKNLAILLCRNIHNTMRLNQIHLGDSTRLNKLIKHLSP